MKASKLVLGNIVTLDPRNPILEAMTIADGKIQYVGSLAIAKQLCDDRTEIMDYTGKYIYPGFIDGHCHGTMAGPRLAYYADLTGGQSAEDYLAIMKTFIAEHPDSKFYYGAGWNSALCSPTAAMLDELCEDKVVSLNSFDGHSLWMNTAGMKEFGINAAAAEAWGTDIVHVYEDGTPTGFVSEGPCNNILRRMSALDKESLKKAALVWQDFALSQGMTAYYEAGATDHYMEVIDELIREGKWKLRTYCGYMMDEKSEDYAADVRRAREAADKFNCEYQKVIGVKIFMDGVVEAHTAWMLDDYLDQPGYSGVKRFCDLERVVDLYVEAEKQGLNVHQHTIGDGAIKFALDAMEMAQVRTGNFRMRNALCHLQAVRKQDIKRLCDLNAVAVVAPLWMSKDDIFYRQSEDYIGTKKTFYSYPMQSFLDNNGVIAFHTDYPVSPAMDAPKSIYMACMRNDPAKEDFYQWNANECISRMDAISGLTTGPAYEVMEENHIGQLRIGYVPNLTIYDTDFLHADLKDVAAAKLVATVIDGEVAYEA